MCVYFKMVLELLLVLDELLVTDMRLLVDTTDGYGAAGHIYGASGSLQTGGAGGRSDQPATS